MIKMMKNLKIKHQDLHDYEFLFPYHQQRESIVDDGYNKVVDNEKKDDTKSEEAPEVTQLVDDFMAVQPRSLSQTDFILTSGTNLHDLSTMTVRNLSHTEMINFNGEKIKIKIDFEPSDDYQFALFLNAIRSTKNDESVKEYTVSKYFESDLTEMLMF